jgi:hypothetical protein
MKQSIKAKLQLLLLGAIGKEVIAELIESRIRSPEYDDHIRDIVLNSHLIFGDRSRLNIASGAIVNN